MCYDKYSQLLTSIIDILAFNWLMHRKRSRISKNVKGKYLKFIELKIADYLCPSDPNISIEEQKWLLKCRVEDIDVKANRRWQHEDISCLSCNTNSDKTQINILQCKSLLEKSEILTYISSYSEHFNGDIQEQVYVSRLLKDNLMIFF